MRLVRRFFVGAMFVVSSFTCAESPLYPVTTPYHEDYLSVGDGHQLYYAEFGNPEGQPILVVHGGPGFGCAASLSAFFDPNHYRVIMFDQRGANRSTPLGEMFANTPQKHIEDIELLRTTLNVDQWTLFGGSRGSTLSLLYGEAHPERVSAFILRGIFLGREQDYKHLFFGMRSHYPEAWDEMIESMGITNPDQLMETTYVQLMDEDPAVNLRAAHAFMKFDTICGSILPNNKALDAIGKDNAQALSVARAFTHYAINGFFLEKDQILKNIDKIANIPAVIVHGRHDHICQPIQAHLLHKAWPNSKLWMIPDAGHFSNEPSLAAALKTATDLFRESYLKMK